MRSSIFSLAESAAISGGAARTHPLPPRAQAFRIVNVKKPADGSPKDFLVWTAGSSWQPAASRNSDQEWFPVNVLQIEP